MFKSKDEERAYLRGKLQGARRVQDLTTLPTTEPWKVVVEQYVVSIKKELAKLEIPQLKEHYDADRVEIPAPWEWDETFKDERDRACLGVDGEIYAEDISGIYGPRLGLRKLKPKRVWFEAEEKPRLPKKGEWFWWEATKEWHKAIFDFPISAHICAIRHEEYDHEPQVVTQADVDSVLGGEK